jgi:hypothetical protein
MAWTLDEFLTVVCKNFTGEIFAEYGDIETDAPSTSQCFITLFVIDSDGAPEDRAKEAWYFCENWADRSGRPVRLNIAGEWKTPSTDEIADSSWGVKTFWPRFSGGSEEALPIPLHSAFSQKSATALMQSVSRFGKWHVVYAEGEDRQAVKRLNRN